MATKFKVLKPSRGPRLGTFRQRMSELVNDTRVKMLRDFRRTTKTWDVPVVFDSSARRSQRRYIARVYSVDPLYALINFGSAYSYHVLSRNFEPKTRPGILDSFPGRGGRLYIGTAPGPGIIARRWDKAAAEEAKQYMLTHLREHIKQWVRASSHAK